MTMLSELKDWLWVINTGALIAGVVLLNWLRQAFVSKADFKEICVKVDGLEVRTAKVEGEMKHMPDKTAVHEMKLAMSEMNGQLGIMNERMKAVAATGDRLQEFRVDQASRRTA
jgi:hypothetical protein